MKLTLLGTGDAIGTPKVGCQCPQCLRSAVTGEMRLRTSLLLENEGHHILIDSSPDLRLQLLKFGSPHIDAVIWTHGHYDHFMGYGEFYRVQKLPPVFAPPPVMDYCRNFFSFLPFRQTSVDAFKPFCLFGIDLTFVEVLHPPAYTCGIIISGNSWKIGYTSDTKADIPAKSLRFFENCDLLLVDALIPSGYHVSKHMNYGEACGLAEKLAAKEFRCVHLSHNIPWDYPNLGRDGQCYQFG